MEHFKKYKVEGCDNCDAIVFGYPDNSDFEYVIEFIYRDYLNFAKSIYYVDKISKTDIEIFLEETNQKKISGFTRKVRLRYKDRGEVAYYNEDSTIKIEAVWYDDGTYDWFVIAPHTKKFFIELKDAIEWCEGGGPWEEQQ